MGKIRQKTSNKNKTKAGSRYYIHAQDVASAVIFILNKGKVGEKFNIVGSKEIDNLQLAKIIAKELKKRLRYKMVDFQETNEHQKREQHANHARAFASTTQSVAEPVAPDVEAFVDSVHELPGQSLPLP